MEYTVQLIIVSVSRLLQMHCFKDLPIEKTRSAVGRFGITGKAQTQPIKNLSDGLRSRVVFAKLAYDTPNMVSPPSACKCPKVPQALVIS